MSDGLEDRRAELIAAAVADQLAPEERAELDALRRTDPSIDDEVVSLRRAAEEVSGAGDWIEASPSGELRDRIARMVADESSAGTVADREPVQANAGTGVRPVIALADRRPRRLALLILGAAACVALGVLGGALIPRADPGPVSGPAGTLGALEAVSFDGEPAGVDIDADLVAHTWGTETVLVIDGLEVGADYTVVVTDREGREHASGSFLGAAATIDCSMNASVLREDVASVSILGEDGAEVATAAVPPVDV